jgi:hypothetical protein
MFGGGRSVLLDNEALQRGKNREYANNFAWDMGGGEASEKDERESVVKR